MKQSASTKPLLATMLLLATMSPLSLASAAEAPASLFTVNYRSLVSRADLTYAKPVDRSEEGLPVGNGRMGSLVWTTPDALKFQLNRADVFAAGCDTRAFPRAGSDYAGGCGMVDIRLVDFGDDVFAAPSFRQHLSVYDGVMTARGNGVTARVMAWQEGDAMVVEIEFVQVQSQAGGQCRLCNPWPGATMSLYRDGAKAEDLSGAFVKFATRKGELIIVVPRGVTPVKRQVQ